MQRVGIGTRVLAFLVDFILVFLLALIAKRGWDFYVVYYNLFPLLFFYFLALIGFLYYLFFEAIWKRTPGKWLALTKVVNKTGGKPSFLQILARSAFRVLGVIIIDSVFIPIIGKTLHDYLSQTEVVEV